MGYSLQKDNYIVFLRGSFPLLAGVMSKVHIGCEVEMLSGIENMLCDEIIDSSQLIFKVPHMTLIDHVALDFIIFILKKIFMWATILL